MKSILFRQTNVSLPQLCTPCRQEVRVPINKDGRVYTVVVRDKITVEDPFIVLVKAVAFAIREGEPYMGRITPRTIRDFLVKVDVVI